VDFIGQEKIYGYLKLKYEIDVKRGNPVGH